MTRYSTPALTIEVPNVDLTACSEIHVTFRQDKPDAYVDVDDPEILDAHTLGVTLTQDQTAGFWVQKPLEIQLNVMLDGRRLPSDILTVPVGDNLLRQVIGA